jgi:hypothetical protein
LNRVITVGLQDVDDDVEQPVSWRCPASPLATSALVIEPLALSR